MVSRRFFVTLAIALFVLNIADYVLTVWALGLGGVEINAAMSPIIGSPAGFVVKVGVAFAVAAGFAVWGETKRHAAWLVLAVMFYVGVVIWNTAQLVAYYA